MSPSLRLAALFALASSASASPAFDGAAPEVGTATKIVGGSTTTAWPQVVLIIRNGPGGGGYCTGFVVARHWVLTAAYCAADVDDPAEVLVGMGNDFSGPYDPEWLLVEATEIRIHPDWDPAVSQGLEFNAALLRLPIAAPSDPLNVDIGPRGEADIGKRGTVVGFGSTGPSMPTTQGVKRAATMQIDAVDPAFLFAEGATPNSCLGDGGAPFHHTATRAVIAMSLITLGPECNAGTGFTRMDTIGPWLAANVALCPPGAECSNLTKDSFEDPVE